ncbi:MAG: hypothetical protein AB8U25_06565 [Rickettsiales endosymbiont of Dermacentor nuttalli]
MRSKSNPKNNTPPQIQKFASKTEDLLKLVSIFTNRLNKESVKFSTPKSVDKTPPSILNIVWTILTPKLMFNVLKSAPALQKDMNKILTFFENPVENYNPNKPPFSYSYLKITKLLKNI